MAKFIMMGRYTHEAAKSISADRTEKAKGLLKKFDGDLEAGYALLGNRDLVFVTNFPGTKEAMKASLALSKLTGISFETHPAVDLQEFDKLAKEI